MQTYLAVFKEFAHPEILDRAQNEGICKVDKAENPCTTAKSDAELAIISTNAKLIITGPVEEAKVEETLAALTALGFKVTDRHPVTSAGCPMNDRVILSYDAKA